MREFMHYVTNAFYGATGWSDDNTYKELNATARELIDFPLPAGLRIALSSLSTPHFATSYQLGSVGVVDGSISYLYSSVPLANVTSPSDRIPLSTLLRSYRQLHGFGHGTAPASAPAVLGLLPAHTSVKGDTSKPAAADADKITTPAHCLSKDGGSLLYGRLYLPQSLLEGLVVKRLTPALQVQLSAVSAQSLRNGGTLLGLVQYDQGNYGVEGLASTDGGLLGVRGLYNFGGDAASASTNTIASTLSHHPGGSLLATSSGGGESSSVSNGTTSTSQSSGGEKERIYGRFSAGAELYYGTLNKSGGISLGARFATLPSYRGTPLTATLTINPLMGNINATYAVLAKDYCSLATRMEFNVYSYESDWAVGMELWSNRRPAGFLLGAVAEEQPGTGTAAAPAGRPRAKERSFQAKLEWRRDDDDAEPQTAAPRAPEAGAGQQKKEKYLGVLKARLDQNLRIGLLWEGRIKSLIFSLGSGIDLHRLDEPFRNLGLEVQYSS
ncbi:hypothetical protein B0H67DRAFT_299607 [Lasiosphaeris hirsuta]|uniref:Mitochondrial distribution and morphology protein 10 n=1 Tax=Lasiosphaeris hirsuta TaxID=260670 RepID=A0AA40A9D8_9PEZI|nr:hypothetical protein B0H67DRAFT_299607 [Lasiosphaeris hirsuta]